MKKVLGGILLVVYSIIAITVTVLLLSFNEYNCSQIGGYTIYIVKDDSLEPEYKQGSILLIKGTSDKNVKVDDEIFLYKVYNSQEYEIVSRKLTGKAQQGKHITYIVEGAEKGEENYANDYFLGKASDTVVIEGWGYVLGLLESKWGYLFCIVIVSLLLFLQEVFELVMEIKYGGGKADKKAGNPDAVEVESVEETEANVRPRTRTSNTVNATKARSTARTASATTTAKTSSAKTSSTAGAKRTASSAKTAATTGTKRTATAAKTATKKVKEEEE